MMPKLLPVVASMLFSDAVHKVQYKEEDIPPYFALARQYTLCDHYFSEIAGPSTPNHLILICADSPVINNPHHHYRPTPGDVYNLKSLPAALEHAGTRWGNYGGYAFHYIKEMAGHPGNHPDRHERRSHARKSSIRTANSSRLFLPPR